MLCVSCCSPGEIESGSSLLCASCNYFPSLIIKLALARLCTLTVKVDGTQTRLLTQNIHYTSPIFMQKQKNLLYKVSGNNILGYNIFEMTFSQSHRIDILLKSELKCLTNNSKRKITNNILVTIVQYTSAMYSTKLYDIITQNNTVRTLVAILSRESYDKLHT